MGRRGPKPAPNLLTAAPATGDVPPPPPAVAGSPAALKVWHSTIALMRSLGTWSNADTAAVARYATLSALHERYAAACLAGDDIHVVSAGGYSTPSPAATQLLKTGAAILALERSLGLVAMARKEFPPPENPDNELRSLLRRIQARS